ncbi:MAG: ribosomal L7Ae/L30e/S12e/Gadd45 family protein [Clostridia bacterium]|nr:ribosomal L7Ae/L30e/S12e/Gadd45 family protein [Clostridia bacterium]
MKEKYTANRLFADKQKELESNIGKILGALGLARNAGGLAIGNDAVSMAISSGKARLVFMTQDISENSREKLMQKLSYAETKYIVLPCTMAELAARLGKTGFTATAALTKSGFEKIIFKCMGTDIKTVKSNDNTTEVHK